MINGVKRSVMSRRGKNTEPEKSMTPTYPTRPHDAVLDEMEG